MIVAKIHAIGYLKELEWFYFLQDWTSWDGVLHKVDREFLDLGVGDYVEIYDGMGEFFGVWTLTHEGWKRGEY